MDIPRILPSDCLPYNAMMFHFHIPGKYQNSLVDWMDAQGEEIRLWRQMLDKPNQWVDGCLLLRASMNWVTVATLTIHWRCSAVKSQGRQCTFLWISNVTQFSLLALLVDPAKDMRAVTFGICVAKPAGIYKQIWSCVSYTCAHASVIIHIIQQLSERTSATSFQSAPTTTLRDEGSVRDVDLKVKMREPTERNTGEDGTRRALRRLCQMCTELRLI